MNISITTEEELESDINGSTVEATVSLSLSNENNLEAIFNFVANNPQLKRLSIYDDYLSPDDKNTKYFCRRVSQVAPDLEIDWLIALAIDGRHGR